MAELPLHLAACRINSTKRAPVWLCLVGREIGAAVISVAHLVGLRRSAKDVALLARSHIEKTGLGVETWRHPIRGAQCSWANCSSFGSWRALVIRDRAAFGIFAVGPCGSSVGIG